MSSLHHLLTFPERPITSEAYVPEVTRLLKSGIPATYTLEQAAAHEQGDKDDSLDETSNTTPLHILARSLPDAGTLQDAETDVLLELMDVLFQFGAGWNFLDYENKHVGDLLLERGYKQGHKLYERIVEAGVSAELLLRKVNGSQVEFLSPDEVMQPEDDATERVSAQPAEQPAAEDATAADQQTYLKTELEYTDSALLTKENRDGVMMDWETDIMKLAAKSLVKNRDPQEDCSVLNIGFGMGIIDSFIQEHKPDHHYICEAHPDVLAKMKQDGWYEKPGVTILEGRWQDSLNRLLDDGSVFFDGIYYDTFSEHYEDMLDLYDVIVGLIKPQGIFSFFNGLGADRPICYDVYRRIVEVDVATYGMDCKYTDIQLSTLPTWDGIKRSYYNCNYYYHPEISFK
ncbi:HDL149Cp [Eremothecium sinecaudum]|uniref:Arginine N-methyltransferase 2 n=1 Tax=Eremothecium sinecaudum TaxID=45286 RepID=A0A120K268_9SACH|nr:HDL149Cp [Eremothecium sinecaudum]AMD20595.1 HDL149Cp [Eremothecium sinecaudum]